MQNAARDSALSELGMWFTALNLPENWYQLAVLLLALLGAWFAHRLLDARLGGRVEEAQATGLRRFTLRSAQRVLLPLAMLLAVLHRHAGVACTDQDVFVNAVGGVRISEPAADLAVMLAITSSLRGRALPKGFIAFGEVGLAGEVRPAPRGQERLKEAAKLGFSVAVVPKANAPKKNDKAFEGLTIHGVDRIEEAMELARNLG